MVCLNNQFENAEFIVQVLSKVLNKLIDTNQHSQMGPQFITKFQSSYAPDITVLAYLERINKYAKCSPNCFIIALVYIDRLIELRNIVLTNLNIHRILITSVLLATKFYDDEFYKNSFYGKLGGISTVEMNALELEYLGLISFNLFVSKEVYEKYVIELKNFHLNSLPVNHSPTTPEFISNIHENSINQLHLTTSTSSNNGSNAMSTAGSEAKRNVECSMEVKVSTTPTYRQAMSIEEVTPSHFVQQQQQATQPSSNKIIASQHSINMSNPQHILTIDTSVLPYYPTYQPQLTHTSSSSSILSVSSTGSTGSNNTTPTSYNNHHGSNSSNNNNVYNGNQYAAGAGQTNNNNSAQMNYATYHPSSYHHVNMSTTNVPTTNNRVVTNNNANPHHFPANPQQILSPKSIQLLQQSAAQQYNHSAAVPAMHGGGYDYPPGLQQMQQQPMLQPHYDQQHAYGNMMYGGLHPAAVVANPAAYVPAANNGHAGMYDHLNNPHSHAIYIQQPSAPQPVAANGGGYYYPSNPAMQVPPQGPYGMYQPIPYPPEYYHESPAEYRPSSLNSIHNGGLYGGPSTGTGSYRVSQLPVYSAQDVSPMKPLQGHKTFNNGHHHHQQPHMNHHQMQQQQHAPFAPSNLVHTTVAHNGHHHQFGLMQCNSTDSFDSNNGGATDMVIGSHNNELQQQHYTNGGRQQVYGAGAGSNQSSPLSTSSSNNSHYNRQSHQHNNNNRRQHQQQYKQPTNDTSAYLHHNRAPNTGAGFPINSNGVKVLA